VERRRQRQMCIRDSIRTTDTEKADKLKGFWDNEEADLKDYKLKII
jgi:hypothetical protein